MSRRLASQMWWTGGATSEPMRVDNLLSWGADLKSMTPATLQKLAKRYLKADAATVVRVVSSAKADKPAAEPKQ